MSNDTVRNIVKEISETEKTYLLSLQKLHTFLGSFTDEEIKKLKTQQQEKIRKLIAFNESHIEPILQQSEALSKSLNDAVDTMDSQPQGDYLGKLSSAFDNFFSDQNSLLYQSYQTSYPEALSLYNELKNETLFSKKIAGLKESTKNLDGADLLIMPIQRAPRYNMLLSDLNSKTNQSIENQLEKSKKFTETMNNQPGAEKTMSGPKNLAISATGNIKFFKRSLIKHQNLKKDLLSKSIESKKISSVKIKTNKFLSSGMTISVTVENFEGTQKSKTIDLKVMKGTPRKPEKGAKQSNEFHLIVGETFQTPEEKKLVESLMMEVGRSIIKSISDKPEKIAFTHSFGEAPKPFEIDKSEKPNNLAEKFSSVKNMLSAHHTTEVIETQKPPLPLINEPSLAKPKSSFFKRLSQELKIPSSHKNTRRS